MIFLYQNKKRNRRVHYLHKHMILIRKVFRMGMPIILWKRILDRFHNACHDTSKIDDERLKKAKNEFESNRRL